RVLQHPRHQVLPGPAALARDQAGEVLVHARHTLFTAFGVLVEHDGGDVAEHVPVAVGETVEAVDHQHRQVGGVVRDQVGTAVGDEGVHEFVGDAAHRAFSRGQ